MTDTTDDEALKPGLGAGPGRNTLYSEELGSRICKRLAEGMTLKAICRMEDIPVAESTVRSWAVNAEHPFSALYARAREVGYHMMPTKSSTLLMQVRPSPAMWPATG